ncbi:hypothetical protein RP20_CCG014825 [Aedes albopictus]|nr:hypothetical protein RP20_CCG014825 [Aedes albopictus]
MTTTKIDQKEYLKRYLSNDKDKKKKKKKKDKSAGKTNVRIIDADDFSSTVQHEAIEDESDLFGLGEEAPQIVGVIDERPPELKAREDFSSNKWRKLAADDGGWGNTGNVTAGPSRAATERDFGRTSRRRDSDESPPRKKHSSRRKDSEESPPRRKGASPVHPSKRGKGYDSDHSPPRRKADDRSRRRDSDESPPRRSQKDHRKRRDSDESPPRRKPRRQSDSDQSPPRKRQDDSRQGRKRKDSGSDQSPPRRTSKKSDHDRVRVKQERSPSRASEFSLRRVKQEPPDSDESPPRRGKNRSPDSDQSPPRRVKREPDSSPSRVRIKRERRSESPRAGPSSSSSRKMTTTLDGKRAGLQDARALKEETEKFRRREAELFDRMSADASGRRGKNRSPDSDQSPPRRVKREPDSSPSRVRIKRERRSESPRAGPSSSSSRKMTTTLDGKRAGLQDARALKEETEKFRRREAELFDRMSADASGRYAKTVVREKSGKRRDVEEELRKEFEKRKRDDKKKEIYTRWGKGVKQVEEYKTQLEEAAHEMNKPLARYKDDEDLDEYLKQQERIGDPMLDYIRSKKKEKDRQEGRPQKPVYKGAFPDNRFGIRPGYRWDGVDRSNGFEKKWFEMMGKKKAVEEEAYKYSVEDM